MTTINMENGSSDDQIDVLINMWQSEPRALEQQSYWKQVRV